MMQRLTLFLIAALVGGCAPDGTLFEANPVSPSAKITVSRDPFSGLDEEGHFKGIGPSEATFRAYFQTITRRMAIALKDEDIRAGVIRGIASAPQQEANIAKLLSSQPQLLSTVTAGFKKEVTGASLADSKLPNIIAAYGDGDAFLAVCEALYGLEIRLIDRGGSYQGSTAIPVFHDPIIDEKDTEHWDGFSPDGEPETMPFSMNGFTRSDPFFYIAYDDEFYYKPENAITALAPPQLSERPTFFAGLSPLLSWLVKPAWAHHPPGHSALPECYHEKSGYLSRFRFTDDHESGSSPEMEIYVNASFRVLPPPWEGSRVPKGYWDYVEADETNTWYPPYEGKYPEMWTHPGYNCQGDVFDASDSNYNKEDWVHVKVMERDLGMWLNPDDKVGEWRFVPTYLQTVHLTPTHAKKHGTPQHAYVYLLFEDPGKNIYNE